MKIHKDQAFELRQKFSEEVALTTKSIAITSGKGGVGKTSISINLSYALAQEKQKVLLIDCDFGLANVDILLNLSVQHTLEEVIEGSLPIEKALIPSGYGFDVLPASSGISAIADMDMHNQKILIKELAKLQGNYDFMIFDTGAGIHKTVLRVNAAADRVIVITNPEPTAITDAYTIIKTLRNQYKVQNFWLLPTQITAQKAEELRKLLTDVANGNGVLVDLALLGSIPVDKTVSNAIFKRLPWNLVNPNAQAVKSLNQVAKNLLQDGKMENHRASEENFSKEQTEGRYRFWKKWVQLGKGI